MIRKATMNDLDRIEEIYNEIHTEIEEGRARIGWTRGVYPARDIAEDSIRRRDMFVMEADGKVAPDHAAYALALRDFVPGEFTETYFGNRPEGTQGITREFITLVLSNQRMWLYFYKDSPWVHIRHAGEDYWAQVSHRDEPGKLIFDTALAWLEAEHAQTA